MRTNAVLAERLCEAKYSETISPGGALIKDGLRPSISAPFLRQRIYTLIRRRYDGAFLGALRPLFLGVEHRGQYEPPQRTEKADVGSRTRTGCVDGTPAVPSRSSDGS